MSDHIYRITAISERVSGGVRHVLECVGHDPETCALQPWWENLGVEMLDLEPLDIALPVHAKPWGEYGPTIELAEPAEPIVWDGSNESLDAIAAALPTGARATGAPTNNKLPMYINLGHGDSVRVPVGWRIQVTPGGLAPFVILPPEVKS